MQVDHAVFANVNSVEHVLHHKVGRACFLGYLVDLSHKPVEVQEGKSAAFFRVKLHIK